MPSETRIFKNMRKGLLFLEKKFNFFSKNFPISVLFLFIGFFLGNIFGTFLNWLREFIVWDGLLIFVLLFFFEIISSIVYQNSLNFILPPVSTDQKGFFHLFLTKNLFSKIILFGNKLKKKSPFKTDTKLTNQLNLEIDYKNLRDFLPINLYFLKNLPMWRLLNCLKVGILFGFFIDAFKVGS